MNPARRAAAGPARGPGRDEAGQYIILYALLGTAMVTMLAIVIDLASLRQDRRADRAMADTAAAAGAIELDPADTASFSRACRAAWDYLLANRPDAGGPVAAPDCPATMPAGTPCDASTAVRTATGTIGTATVEISHPVPDGDGLMLAETQGGDRAQAILPGVDGTSCQRLAVRVVRSRALAFAAIAGLATGRTDVHSVARPVVTTVANPVPGVVALDPSACQVLTSSPDGGALRVAGVGQPGYAVVDSDGSTCPGGSYVVDAGDPSAITALPDGPNPGIVASYALGAGNGLAAFDPTDVAAGRLAPAPSALTRRLGSSFMTVRYNCASCGPGQDHIDQLRAQLQAGVPAGASVYGDDPVLEPCTVTAPTTFGPGTWLVACPGGFIVQADVDFAGGTIVFDGGVNVGPGACLAVGSGGCGGVPGGADNIVYLRAGDLVKAGDGLLDLDRTFVHLTAGAIDVAADVAGSARLLWSAPFAGNFEDLLAWGEAGVRSQLGGQGTLLLDGTVYLPNGLLTLTGRTGGSTAGVQLVAGRLRLVGGDAFEVRPSSTRATGAIVRTVRLIR